MTEVAERAIGWLHAAEETLDRWGMPAWIGAMVLGFIVVWPVGLAILGYMIWSGRMGCKTRRQWRDFGRRMDRPTGNAAFDEYREETLRRLEEEQEAFSGFLEQLRRAKDRAEFERFMTDRRGARDAAAAPPEGPTGPAAEPA